MKNNCFQAYIAANTQYRTEQFEGQQYLVVPVIALVEGVHHGSQGAYYYPASEIANFAETWNGRDVPVFHPEINGELVSVNSPEVIQEWSVGRTFNFRAEDGKLKGEVWINLEKARQKAPEVLNMIYSGQRLEVSTGLFSDEIRDPGQWNGEQYDVVARNIRPDHLALLPGGRGACSWEDGCGIRANEKGGKKMPDDEIKEIADKLKDNDITRKESHTLLSRLKALFKHKTAPKFLENEVSFDDTMRALQQAVDAMDNGRWVHYVRKVYNDRFIYLAEPNMELNQNASAILYQQKYSIDDNGVVTLSDEEPVEVVEKPVEFVAKTNEKQEVDMTDEKKPCCEETVQMLIENEDTSFTEDHREWLLSLSEDQLKAVTPVTPKLSPVAQAAADVAEGTIPTEADGKTPQANKEVEEAKVVLIKGILANDETFTEDELKELDLTKLIKLNKRFSEKAIHNYAGNAGNQQRSGIADNEDMEEDGEPLPLPGIPEPKKKD